MDKCYIDQNTIALDSRLKDCESTLGYDNN